jgi:chromodomain-helicase-DNA-binding protein 7
MAVKQVLNELGQPKKKYLVKWKILPYVESTWEYPESFKDDEKIEEFNRVNTIPPPEPTKHVKGKWRQMKESPKFKSENRLRPYQLEGMNWLSFCWHEGRGSILADEMGTFSKIESIE